MPTNGITKKQMTQAILDLKEAGMRAWPTATGHSQLWVSCPEAFPGNPTGCGRISVGKARSFIKLTREQYLGLERAMQWPEDLAAYDRLNTPINGAELGASF
jgi:hypothetical protein